MRSPQFQEAATGNETPPLPGTRFQSTVSTHKLRRFNILILVFRFAAFCFSLAVAIFMLTNSKGSDLPRWQGFEAYRFVAVANSIVVLYSLLETGASIWEILRASTILPKIIQDQGVDTADFIAFLLELSFHVTGEAYNVNTLTDVQRHIINDLADLGLVKLQQGRKESWFIPTKLATHLSINLADSSSRKQVVCIESFACL